MLVERVEHSKYRQRTLMCMFHQAFIRNLEKLGIWDPPRGQKHYNTRLGRKVSCRIVMFAINHDLVCTLITRAKAKISTE